MVTRSRNRAGRYFALCVSRCASRVPQRDSATPGARRPRPDIFSHPPSSKRLGTVAVVVLRGWHGADVAAQVEQGGLPDGGIESLPTHLRGRWVGARTLSNPQAPKGRERMEGALLGRRASSSRFDPAHTGSEEASAHQLSRLSLALGACGSSQKPLARCKF